MNVTPDSTVKLQWKIRTTIPPSFYDLECYCNNILKMAEGVGFEPTVAVRPRLISSQVRSTRLRHPSAQRTFQNEKFTIHYTLIRSFCQSVFFIPGLSPFFENGIKIFHCNLISICLNKTILSLSLWDGRVIVLCLVFGYDCIIFN